jgi:hypothetical protein
MWCFSLCWHVSSVRHNSGSLAGWKSQVENVRNTSCFIKQGRELGGILVWSGGRLVLPSREGFWAILWSARHGLNVGAMTWTQCSGNTRALSREISLFRASASVTPCAASSLYERRWPLLGWSGEQAVRTWERTEQQAGEECFTIVCKLHQMNYLGGVRWAGHVARRRGMRNAHTFRRGNWKENIAWETGTVHMVSEK